MVVTLSTPAVAGRAPVRKCPRHHTKSAQPSTEVEGCALEVWR
jgi:hypothetical protein